MEDDHRLATLIAEFLAKQLFQVKVISRGDTTTEDVAQAHEQWMNDTQ
ncbi:DNA-binding transcriptional regulator RstA [Yersinia mollaretii ATCC 43969]|uniref:DNA-binding transcriptional regulator RstA n=1 Tax=Yersinia mollaretii (strain ATCC 43969 / DSM 18520 / CIP 103324 / CNY 7263 / WAIP 204) TaxID=349967 RepID=A0ABM9Y7Q7_YERMW|nr:DNA-binding transcriptional regulator RstA [Yersinia mollaretii ATCC 43969]